MSESSTNNNSVSKHSLTGGLIVLGVGVFFLLVNTDVLPPMRESWPIILIVVGVALILARFRR